MSGDRAAPARVGVTFAARHPRMWRAQLPGEMLINYLRAVTTRRPFRPNLMVTPRGKLINID
ncbi:MAG: hypothetical protein GEU97_18940 [Actinophytocola sp.]|nr:hypothetical protein [Actinophytocola sp.]